MLGKAEDFGWIGITAHEADTGDETGIFLDEGIQKGFVEGFADVFRQVRTMATRAVTRTIREIQGKCYLARNLLKYDIVGSDFQHAGALAGSA